MSKTDWDAKINAIPEEGRKLIRKKEAFVVAYFKSEWKYRPLSPTRSSRKPNAICITINWLLLMKNFFIYNYCSFRFFCLSEK